MAAVKTVKESVSGRLSGLKFMQRAKIRDDEFKKQEAEVAGEDAAAADDSHWVMPAVASSRCKVIVEGDPKPGAVIGRMSFQNCNPSVERIVEEVQARRERIRNVASTSNGKEEKPVVSTAQARSNGAEEQKVDDVENLSMRKRQKVEKVEKLAVSQNGGEVKVEKSSILKANNSFTALRGSENENEKRQHQQQQQQPHRETKQKNPRTDWRSLRPPGR